ncbi:MAG: hypothetical protein HY725_05635 [Candidatus Rokubacteria bacterium]|nr:hypothetical protein [Candidatus Rokubacteria bacterium]
MAKAHYSKIDIKLETSKINLYAGSRIAAAVEELAKNMTLYEGVRYAQILEAVYRQGKKDGASEAFEAVGKNLKAAELAIPHKNPGRPKKHK